MSKKTTPSNKSSEENETSLSFESAFSQLEQIVEKFNKEMVPLEEALSLYEQATSLMSFCQKRLSQAEQKIDILLKNQQGELALSEEKVPLKEPFATVAE